MEHPLKETTEQPPHTVIDTVFGRQISVHIVTTDRHEFEVRIENTVMKTESLDAGVQLARMFAKKYYGGVSGFTMEWSKD